MCRPLLIVLLLGVSQPALPCGNEVAPLQSTPLKRLLLAQRRFDVGDYHGVLRAFMYSGEPDGKANAARFYFLKNAAILRLLEPKIAALGVEAVGVFRSEACGEALRRDRHTREALPIIDEVAQHALLPIKRRDRQLLELAGRSRRRWNTCNDRAQAAAWKIADSARVVAEAIGDLEYSVRLQPGDPALTAVLAEALSLTQGRTDQALAILDDLEKRDLLPDAWTWAALARLRALHRDAAGAARAVARCRQTAHDAAICLAAPLG